MKIAFLISTSLQYPHLLPVYEEAKKRGHDVFIGYNPYIGLDCYRHLDLPTWDERADVVVLADTGEGRCFPHERDYLLTNVHHGFADKGAHYWEEGLVNTDVQFCSGEEIIDRYGETGARCTVLTGEPKIDRLWNGFKSKVKPIDILWSPTFNNHLTSLFVLQDRIEELGNVTMKPHMAMWPVRRKALKDLNKKITVLPETEYDIVPYILASKKVIADYSSVMFEAMLADKEVYIYQPKNSHEYEHFAEKKYETCGVIFHTFEELQEALSKPYPDLSVEREYMKSKMHPYRDGKSAERIVDSIERIWKERT